MARSADLLAACERPLVRAAGAEDAGAALVGVDRRRGVALLTDALELYAEAGAELDASRVRDRLRSLGAGGQRTGAPRPGGGWAALSESELRVVRLVAEGATNRQVAQQLVLSPHTVNNHLRHVYAKLDVSSRVELTRIALSHDLGEHIS
jgi:DNA-binding CsgD family transcriptional regulator